MNNTIKKIATVIGMVVLAIIALKIVGMVLSALIPIAFIVLVGYIIFRVINKNSAKY
jgi:hypothetical protein